jgi:hypothetical protein
MSERRILCHSCEGKGFVWEIPVNSEFREVAVRCYECNGDGYVKEELYFLECFGHPNMSDACGQCPKNAECCDAQETILVVDENSGGKK